MTSRIKTYTGLVIQPAVKVAQNRDDIMLNLNRVLNMIDFGVGYFWELPARLAVLPEYFLQGVTTPGKGEDGLKEFVPSFPNYRELAPELGDPVGKLPGPRDQPSDEARPLGDRAGLGGDGGVSVRERAGEVPVRRAAGRPADSTLWTLSDHRPPARERGDRARRSPRG